MTCCAVLLLSAACTAAPGDPALDGDAAADAVSAGNPNRGTPGRDAGNTGDAPADIGNPAVDSGAPASDASKAVTDGTASSVTDARGSTVDAPTSRLPLLSSSFGIVAPNDSDTDNYSEKNYSAVTSLSQYPTITRGGVVKFGPVADPGGSGKVVLRHDVTSGDPLYHNGNRAELTYDGTLIGNGIDYWIAFAYELAPNWVQSSAGGNNDQQVLMQIHDLGAASPPFAILWTGGSPGTYGDGQIVVGQALQGSDLPSIFRLSARSGVWNRIILHYRSGPDATFSPTLEMWSAGPGEPFVQASPLISATSPFGETQSSPSAWPRIGIYKWTYTAYGSIGDRAMYSSGLYFAEGVNLYAEAVNALSGY